MSNPERIIEPALPVPAERITLAIALAAILAFLPELLLVNTELWTAVALAIWAFGGLLHVNATGLVIIATLFGTLGLWATYMTMRMAIANRADASKKAPA